MKLTRLRCCCGTKEPSLAREIYATRRVSMCVCMRVHTPYYLSRLDYFLFPCLFHHRSYIPVYVHGACKARGLNVKLRGGSSRCAGFSTLTFRRQFPASDKGILRGWDSYLKSESGREEWFN